MSAVKQLQTFTVIMYVVFSSSTDTSSGGRAQAGNNTKKPWGCINAYKELFLNYYTSLWWLLSPSTRYVRLVTNTFHRNFNMSWIIYTIDENTLTLWLMIHALAQVGDVNSCGEHWYWLFQGVNISCILSSFVVVRLAQRSIVRSWSISSFQGATNLSWASEKNNLTR